MTEEIKMVYELTKQIESFNSRLRSIERYLGICSVEKNGNTIIAQHDPSFDNVHHCGQDADEHQPAGYTYKDLLGMEVIGIGGMAAQSCVYCGDADCVKVELVGGDFMCLKKPRQKESITALDDSTKSLEEVYRENMELIRRHSIEQSEANKRLFDALRGQSEELKNTTISFDEENEESLVDTMKRIKEDTEAFMDYLDSVTKKEE